MPEPHVSLDPASLNPVEEKLRGPLEEQLTSALQAATDQTRHSYAGEDVDEVTEVLLDRTRAGLHPDIAAGLHTNPDQLRRVAQEIVGGS